MLLIFQHAVMHIFPIAYARIAFDRLFQFFPVLSIPQLMLFYCQDNQKWTAILLHEDLVARYPHCRRIRGILLLSSLPKRTMPKSYTNSSR